MITKKRVIVVQLGNMIRSLHPEYSINQLIGAVKQCLTIRVNESKRKEFEAAYNYVMNK